MTPDSEDWLGTWWARAIVTGLGAAFVSMALMMTALHMDGLGLWTYLNVIGAAVPGLGVPSAGFDNFASPMGLVLQGGLGALAAWAYAGARRALVPWPGRRAAAAVAEGLLLGVLMYVALTRTIGGWVDPALSFLPTSLFAIAHMAFGAIVAGLVWLDERRETVVITFAPLETGSARAQLDEQLPVSERAGTLLD